MHKPIRGTNYSLYYNPAQHLGFLFQRTIRYEPEFVDYVLNLIRPGDVVFEIGSNIGQYSLLIADKIGSEGKLVCLEPDSDNFAFLSFNMLKNQLHNVQVLQMAVSDKEGEMQFYKDTVTGGRTSSLLQAYTGSNYQGKTESVAVTTFEALIHRFGTPAFVKVDVEGAEVMIFEKANKLPRSTIYFVEVRRETAAAIFEIFRAQGFHIYSLGKKMKELIDATEAVGFDNWIIRSEER